MKILTHSIRLSRRLKLHRAAPLTTLAIALLAATTLQAGQINGFTPYPGINSVAGTSVDAAPTPNDNVVGTSGYEAFVTQKDYIAIAPVDIEFSVIDNGGVTEYAFVEGVNNSTGITWEGYHIELGFGTGGGFVKSAPGDGLDFDAPDFDSPIDFNPGPGIFASWDVDEDDILAYDGDQASGEFADYFLFSIDVPDGITSFTLRQSPVETVPEPASLVMALLGLLPLGYVARRMRRRG